MAKPSKALRKAAIEYKMRQQYGDGLYDENYKQKFLLKQLANKINQEQMGKQESKFETKLRNSIHSELKNYCTFAKPDSFIEVTEWTNEEGIDVYISDFGEERISMTWGQWKLLKKLVKELENS